MARHDEEKAPPPSIRTSSLSGNLAHRINDTLEGEILLGEVELFAGNGVAVTATRVILVKAGFLAGNSTRVIPIPEIQKVITSSMKGMTYLEFQTLEPITDANRLSWSIQTGPTSKAAQAQILELIAKQREQVREAIFAPLSIEERERILAEEAFRAQARAQYAPAPSVPVVVTPLKRSVQSPPKKQNIGCGSLLTIVVGLFVISALARGCSGASYSSTPPPAPTFGSSAPVKPVVAPDPAPTAIPESVTNYVPDPVASPTPTRNSENEAAVALLYAADPGSATVQELSSRLDDALVVCPESTTDVVLLVSNLYDELRKIGRYVPPVEILKGLVLAKPNKTGLTCLETAAVLLTKMRAR
jgi:hypothetical protein